MCIYIYIYTADAAARPHTAFGLVLNMHAGFILSLMLYTILLLLMSCCHISYSNHVPPAALCISIYLSLSLSVYIYIYIYLYVYLSIPLYCHPSVAVSGAAMSADPAVRFVAALIIRCSAVLLHRTRPV